MVKKELLRMRQVYIAKAGHRGINHFCFHMNEGEIIYILGYNGAGKTTLYDYFNGKLPLESGKIEFDGQICLTGEHFPYVSKVVCLGKHSTLIPGLTVAENIFIINRKRKAWNLVNMTNVMYRAKLLLSQYAPELSPKTLVRNLSPADRRIVELLRAIENEAKMIFLDDVLQGFGQSDLGRICRVLQDLKNKNISVICASHEVTIQPFHPDRVVAMRQGTIVRCYYEQDYTEQRVRNLLLGREFEPTFQKKSYCTDKIIFSMYHDDIDRKKTYIAAKKGEIIGVYDKDNRKNIYLLQMILGKVHSDEYEMFFEDEVYVPENFNEVIEKRISYMAEGTRDVPLVDTMNFGENISLPILQRICHQHPLHVRKMTEVLNKEYGPKLKIPKKRWKDKTDCLDAYTRVCIFMECMLLFQPKMMICIEPWVGGDLTFQDMIMYNLMRMAKQGAAVLIASQNMNELRSVCDSIYVVSEENHTAMKYII